MYYGHIVKFHSDSQRVDVEPNDPRLPSMSNVPFRHGLPGVVVAVDPGTSVLIGWENGDPARRFACLWQGGEHVSGVTFSADAFTVNGQTVTLGGALLAEPPLKGTTHNAELQVFLTALDKYVAAIKGVADPSNLATPDMLGAIVALQTALPQALATNVLVK
jgi:hypothetical protein